MYKYNEQNVNKTEISLIHLWEKGHVKHSSLMESMSYVYSFHQMDL